MKFVKHLCILIAVIALLIPAGNVFAKKYGPGVTDTEIKIGTTTALSGPASAYAAIEKTAAAYFDMINDKGGINGRKINFIMYDDGYSPPKTKEQFRKLIERDRVLCIVNPLGTPTNSAVHRYVNKKKVPHLFLASGAAKWDNPKKYPWTMGMNPSYRTEGKFFAGYVLDNHPNGKVAVLYQNDDYGKDLFNSFKEGLGSKASSMIVAEESYEVTEPTIDSQVIKLKASGADIFLNITTPKFAAQAIKKVYALNWKPVHLLNNVGASPGTVIKPVGYEKAQGIITDSYFIDPGDRQYQNHPAVKEYFAFMKKYAPKMKAEESNNILGYLAGQTMIQVLKQCGDNLTRENVMKQAANLRNFKAGMLYDGTTINTSPTDYSPIESMQPRKFVGEEYISFGKVVRGGNDRLLK